MKYYAVILKKKKKRASTQNALLTCEKSRMLKDWYCMIVITFYKEKGVLHPRGAHTCVLEGNSP